MSVIPGFHDRLRRGDLLVGTLVTLRSPEVVEILAAAGADWLFLDAEHGAFAVYDLPDLLRAAGACPCLVRVPCCDETLIGRALDAGAAGVIVPQVNDAATAARAVAAARYPPEGCRGAALARAQGYGFDRAAYMADANRRSVVVVQAEHRDAVEQIDSIVAVEGLDAVFIGPFDLAGSLGHAGEPGHPEVLAAADRVRDACVAAGLCIGAFGAYPSAARAWLERGHTLVAVGSDTLLMGAAARDAFARAR